MGSLTKNLKLKTFDGSEYVSYKDINTNFETLDNVGVDYIVDQGTSGNWTYRTYKSGISECWGRFTFGATTTKGAVHAPIKFPYPFKEPPTISLTAGVYGRVDAYMQYASCTATDIDCYVNKNTSDNLSYWVYARVIGRVK